MAQQKIYLRKVRDFGENLGDTFQFIRQEFKPLLKSFFFISGIFILSASILSGIYQFQITNVFDKTEPGDSFPTETFLSFFSGAYLLAILMVMIGILVMNICVSVYMKLVDEHESSPALEEVWDLFRKYFFRCLLLMIIITIIAIIATVICILPIVLLATLISPLMIIPGLIFLLPMFYVFTVFTPAFMIMINEDAGIGETLSRCFTLSKKSFWVSLFIYLIAYLIYSFAAGIIGVVLGIFIGIGSYMSTREMDSTMAIVSSVTNLFSYSFYLIFAVSVGLNYYSLTEKSDGIGIMRRLETIGSTDPNAKMEEQY